VAGLGSISRPAPGPARCETIADSLAVPFS
jgi:hypothetical protein